MSFIIRNNKINKILFIITISIILFSISLNVKAVENKIEIKDGNQIITDTTGTLKTPKVLNVNTNVEKKLTINYLGVDNNRLDYHLEEKEGNLDFDVNVLTGEIKLKAKSGTNFGAVFSLVDRQTKKVYPISLVIRAIDGKSKVSLLGSVKNMKFNTISGNMYLEGIADLKRVIEGGINPLNEKPTMYLKNLNTQRTVELSVEKVSTYEYRFRIKAEDMAEDDKYTIYAKIVKQNTYADNSSLERQLTIERAVPNTIENNRYKLTNSDDNISIKTKPVTYNLNANLVDMYGFHREQNDYVIGTADIFLKDNDGNRIKPREVKIYAEKNGNKTYFNVYNNRYDFELLLNNVEAGEYAIYAEAIGNNGKTYREKLWIGGHLRKSITVSGMQTEARVEEGRIILKKKGEPNYIIRTNTNSMYGFHRGDGNDYIIGTADIFLSDENGNRVKPREVKIYAEKDGKKTYFNVYNDRYDFELLLNSVDAGEYTIYAEAVGNNGKTYREKLWIGSGLRRDITVNGMKKVAIISNNLLIEKREKDIEYELEQPELVALVDERQYIYGNLTVKLKEISNNSYTGIRNVKIYAEKDGVKNQFYVKDIGNEKYYYDFIINHLKNFENYNIYIEVEDNNGRIYRRGLDFSKLRKNRLTVRGFNRKVNLQGTNMYIEKTNNDEVDFEQGIYGQSGLKVKGDSRGQDLRYYKFGNGKNVFYATFALHGFEDLWNNDGKELTYIAERFKDYLIRIGKSNIFKDWTLYLFPQVNPDGTNHGWTNNGPGRTTLYSSAPGNRGIDLNRNFRAEGTEHTKFTGDRNYNGEIGFEAYEAKFLSEFIKATQSKNGKNVLVDTHRMAWRNYRR